jgi:Asp-tRNA(Asn)/Glu-tRNA(Gln) amidotransferase A subunit family amidase
MRVDDADDPAKFLNAPLSLQIACQRWEDEKVLAALSVIAAVVCG